jgi:hypothetical protein
VVEEVMVAAATVVAIAVMVVATDLVEVIVLGHMLVIGIFQEHIGIGKDMMMEQLSMFIVMMQR